MPAISVVMPVYNTPVSFLQEAVDSILNQTFSDFEFIIVDDGSTGGTRQYLDSLVDPRIRPIRNETNIGITQSLNIGFRAAQGKYIARMDSDDISMPQRFEKQFAYMESHPETIMCGTAIEKFGDKTGIKRTPIDDLEQYRCILLFVNPGPSHPTAFFNKSKLLQHHIQYANWLLYGQDYELWVEISKIGKMTELSEVLLRYRVSSQQVGNSCSKMQARCAQLVQKKQLCELLGKVSEDEVLFHYKYSTGYYADTVINQEIVKWYKRILKENRHKNIYHQKKLKKIIRDRLFRLTINACSKESSLIKKTALCMRYHMVIPMTIRNIRKQLHQYKKYVIHL